MSIQTKLSKLARTKSQLRNAFITAGIDMPVDEPFGNYHSHIAELSNFVETTDTTDMMEVVDFYELFARGEYTQHIYTESEQNEILTLCNLIIEGEVI